MGWQMKDAEDWNFILDTVDALFYRIAVGVACRSDMSLADCHEGLWTSFEQGCFRLRCGDDDDDIGVVPCETDNDQRAAIDQNKPLASYRQRVIEDAVAAA